MGFLSSLKKLFFVQESLAKSSGEKIKDFTKEKFDGLKDSGQKGIEEIESNIHTHSSNLKNAFTDVKKDLKKTAKTVEAEVSHKLSEFSENENIKKAADFTEKVGNKVLEAGEKTFEKISELGKKMEQPAGEISKKAAEVSEKLGEKLTTAKNEMVQRAKELSDDLGAKFDELTERAMEESEALKNQTKNEFSDKTLDAGPSLLEDKDDFFSKAQKYADGNYSAFSDSETNKSEKDSQSEELVESPDLSSINKDELPPLMFGDSDAPDDEEAVADEYNDITDHNPESKENTEEESKS
jgi:hypothetical protein